MARGLRKRQTPFVQIPSSTIRDGRLSFRARGVLAYLLDMPPEWDVRSEVLAANGTEGREAIRTALHELGRHGYYRLERRKLLDGTFEMGTAISEEPVPEWAAEYAEFEGKAVTVIEQEDGSFKVRRKDGSLVDDGFGVPDRKQSPPPAEKVPSEEKDQSSSSTDKTAGRTGDGFLGAGSPDSGSPDSGSLGAINRRETQNRETDTGSLQEPAAREQRQESLLEDVPPAPTDTPHARKPAKRRPPKKRTPEEQARFELADAIAKAWWTRCDKLNIPNIRRGNASAFPGFRAMLERALAAGCTADEIKWALNDLQDPFPTASQLQKAITRQRGIALTPAYGRPASARHLQVIPGGEQKAQQAERRELFG